jgi:hypothetical protein
MKGEKRKMPRQPNARLKKLIESRIPLPLLATMLGHRTLQMTLHYHAAPESKEELIEHPQVEADDDPADGADVE